MNEESLAWGDDFQARHSRAPRVLHVGNVGNNAYLNARFLRDHGVDCHVLSYDYYDRLATPEWEGDERPAWFAQGPLAACVAYLGALDAGDRARQASLGRRLRVARAIPPGARYMARRARIRAATMLRARAGEPVATASAAGAEDSNGIPASDAAPFRPALPIWRDLFARYDIVQCYATDPIWPLLAGYHPYIAFEHGTLRVVSTGDDPVSRLTAEAYRRSDHTFVTNGDCLPHAERLGIPRMSPMIHPLDVERHEASGGAESARLRRQLGADVVLFSPMRQDWEVKGSDVHIRAFPRILAQTEGRAVLVLCRWGSDLARSRRLVSELGLSRNVAWFDRMPRARLIAMMKAADAVLDQMTLPHFDATAPQALAAGVPVIGSYEPDSTAWIVPEPAPIVSAFDAEGVAAAVRTVLDADWRRSFDKRAHEWIHRHHHPRRLVADHFRVYRQVLES